MQSRRPAAIEDFDGTPLTHCRRDMAHTIACLVQMPAGPAAAKDHRDADTADDETCYDVDEHLSGPLGPNRSDENGNGEHDKKNTQNGQYLGIALRVFLSCGFFSHG